MESVKVCRVCLAMDVKMFSMQGPLGNSYKFLIGEHMILSSGSLPHYTCYECTELIRKSTAFKEKCLRAQMALCNILRNNNKISDYEIKLIDRNTTKLKSQLTVYSLPSENLYQYQPPIEEVQIKEECCDLEMIVEESDKKEDDVSRDITYGDDLPLKYLTAEKQRKKAKKHKHSTCKKARVKDKVKAMSETKPEQGNIPTAVDNIAKYFVVTKLSMEEQIAEVLKRKQCANYRDSPFKCEDCYKGFLLEDTLKNHLERHDTSAGDIICGVCKFRFATRRAFSLHAARHARRYACGACAFVTVHMDQAKKHKAWHDGVTYKCQHCDEVSTKLTSYLSHLRVKHPSPWVCARCGYSFVSARGLAMHRARMHRGPQRPPEEEPPPADDGEASRLHCSACDVRFATEEALKRHTVTSTAHRDHLGSGCRECGEVLPSAAGLRAHRATHARNLHARSRVARARYVPRRRRDQPYPAKCEHCEEMIPNRSRHWKHYQRCHQDKKYPLSETNFICEVCGKGFPVHAFLTYHLRTHSAERVSRRGRAHPCALCTMRFHTKPALRLHIKSHAGAGEPTQHRVSARADDVERPQSDR